MDRSSSMRPSRLPIRWRLTLWYLLILTAILLLFAGFLYWQVRRTLLAHLDAGLQLAATQAMVNVNAAGSRLAFDNIENAPELTRRLGEDSSISLLATDGAVWDHLGKGGESPDLTPISGFDSVTGGDDAWRIYGEPVSITGSAVNGWLLVVKSLESVTDTLTNLRLQLLWGLPLALLLAGLGGYFLAGRALSPIDRITRTAGYIDAGALEQRIDYDGPADEVGRLAATFDSMLERLQAAFNRERRFTADAAHELRTPLTALKGRIGVTRSRPRTVPEHEATLQEMEGQVDRLIQLSNDLLFMTRLEQEGQRLRRERIDLLQFMEAVVEQMTPLALTKDIEVRQAIPQNLTLQGNLDLLVRLFMNLLDNALKYTPQGGIVTIMGQQHKGFVDIAFIDTGPGIPAEHLPHLFDRFYRVEGDRARQLSGRGQGGSGLGLAIAQEIARAHGGKLSVRSEVGQGTTFTVQLPVFGVYAGS